MARRRSTVSTPAELAQFYQSSPGNSTAFVDESYRLPDQFQRGDIGFYEMTAVILEKSRFAELRDSLRALAGGNYWHTTEAFKDSPSSIRRMVDFVIEASEWNIVSVATPIADGNDGLQSARAQVLSSLVTETTRGNGVHAVRGLVADNIRAVGSPTHDQATMHRLRGAGNVSRHVQLRHARQGEEPLLWTADVTAWAIRRNLAVADGTYVVPLLDAEKLTTIEAQTGRPLVMKHPPTAAARSRGQRPRPHNVTRRADVVSESSLNPVLPEVKNPLGDLYQQAVRLRSAAQQQSADVPARSAAAVDHSPPPKRDHGPTLT